MEDEAARKGMRSSLLDCSYSTFPLVVKQAGVVERRAARDLYMMAEPLNESPSGFLAIPPWLVKKRARLARLLLYG